MGDSFGRLGQPEEVAPMPWSEKSAMDEKVRFIGDYQQDGAGVAAWMRRVSPGSHNRSALDGDDFTQHSPLRVSPNGLRAPAFIFPAQV